MNAGRKSSELGIVRVVLDTNVLVSAIEYGGKPREALLMAMDDGLKAVTSPELLAELARILKHKFNFSDEALQSTMRELRDGFTIVNPTHTISVLRDEPDNRVLEAAVEGDCTYTVTGDNEILALGKYKNIRIVTVDEFLKKLK